MRARPRLVASLAFGAALWWLVPGGAALTYDSNCGSAPGDIDRRHVSRVSLAGGKPVDLTSGSGIEFVSASTGKDGTAWIASTPTTPMRVTLSSGGKARVLGDGGAAYAPKGMVVPKPVTFTAIDGITVHGQLFQSANAKNQPALVFVHGGPPRQMLLGWSYMDYYTHAYAMKSSVWLTDPRPNLRTIVRTVEQAL